MKNTRLLVVLLLFVCSFSAHAASACASPNTTYATLISYGSTGCQVGDFLFYNFQSLSATLNGANYTQNQNDVLAAAINVSFTEVTNGDGSRTVSMTFDPSSQNYLAIQGIGDLSTGSSGTFDLRPAFNVNVTPSDPSLGYLSSVGEIVTGRLTDNQPSGNNGAFKSYITASETVTSSLGGASIHPSPTIIDTTADHLPYNAAGCFYCGGGSNDLSGSVVSKTASMLGMTNSSLPTGTVIVSKDILINSGKDTNNFAALDSLTEQFTQQGTARPSVVTATPEPSQFVLFGTGILALWKLRGYGRKKSSKTKVS